MVRTHLVANAGRVHLLNLYLDELYHVTAMHTATVLADKGLDLKNMTSMDVSKMKLQLSSRQRLHIVGDMNSASFHAFLRHHSDRLQDINMVFGAAKYLHSVDLPARRKAILDLVFKKRRLYVTQLYAARKMVLKIPKVTLGEVRQFIHGGVDPIQVYLIDAYQKYDAATYGAQHQHHQQQHDSQHSNVLNLHVLKDENGEVLRNSSMCLLKSITPEDLALLYIVVAERSVEARTIARKQLRAAKALNPPVPTSGAASGGQGLAPRASVSGANMMLNSNHRAAISATNNRNSISEDGSASGATSSAQSTKNPPSAGSGRRQSTAQRSGSISTSKHHSPLLFTIKDGGKEDGATTALRPATPPGRKNSNNSVLEQQRRSSRKN